MFRPLVILSLCLSMGLVTVASSRAQNKDPKDRPLLQRLQQLQQNPVLKDLQKQFQPQQVPGKQNQFQPQGIGPGKNQFQPQGLGPNQFAPPQKPPQKQYTAEDLIRMFIPPQVQQGQWNPQVQPQPGGVIDPGFDPNYGQPRPPTAPVARRVPTGAQVAAMTAQQQRTMLRMALMELDVELSMLKVGPGWKKYLHTELLGSKLWNNRPPEPGKATRDILQQIHERFKTVATDPQHSFLQKLWGFKTINVVLGAYTMDPIARDLKSVHTSVGPFIGSLNGTTTGDGWITYLKLKDLSRIASAKGDVSKTDQDILREIAKRFDKVNSSSQYESIKRLYGFDTTHQTIRKLIAALIAQQQEAASAAPGLFESAPDRSPTGTLKLKPDTSDKSATGTLKLAPGKGASDKSAMGTLKLVPPDNDKVTKTGGKVTLLPLPVPDKKDPGDKVKLLPLPVPDDRDSKGKVTLKPDLEAVSVSDQRRQGTGATAKVEHVVRGVIRNISSVDYKKGSGTVDLRVITTDGSFAVIKSAQVPDLAPNETFEIIGLLPAGLGQVAGYSVVINAEDLTGDNNRNYMKIK